MPGTWQGLSRVSLDVKGVVPHGYRTRRLPVNLWEVLMCMWFQSSLGAGQWDSPPLCLLRGPYGLQGSVLQASSPRVHGESFIFPRRPDNPRARRLLGRKMPRSMIVPTSLRAEEANLSARLLCGVAGNLALFPSLAIAMACPLRLPEIGLLHTVQVCLG